MTVVYEPPLTRSGPWQGGQVEPLRVGPRFARSRGMSRWHRVRSGTYHRPASWHDGFVSYTFWCGQSASSARRPRRGAVAGLLAQDALPGDGAPICGTCEGRAVGAGHDPAAVDVVHGPGLLFTPERLIPPKVCPAVGTKYWHGPHRLWEEGPTGWPSATCLACGAVVGSWGETIRSHRPGPDLVPGCEFHAWRYLVHVDGQTVCRCRCTEQP